MNTAAHIGRRVRASGRRYWTIDELRDGVESMSAAKAAVHRLVESGELRRVRRGLYWHDASVSDRRVRARKVRTAGRAARAVVFHGEATGASGWHATNLLGLSTQLSPVDVIAVTQRPPRPIPGVRFVDRSARRGRRDQRLTELEVTILEAIEGWQRYVEVAPPRAIERFIELLGSEGVRPLALARASASEPAATRERLRELLLRGGWTEEARVIRRAVDNRTRQQALTVFETS